jgi:hypothetical protein
MPTYTFTRKSTGEEWTINISLAEREELLKDPDIEQSLCTPAFGDSARMGLRKPDMWFRDKLRQIKKHNPRSNINTFD